MSRRNGRYYTAIGGLIAGVLAIGIILSGWAWGYVSPYEPRLPSGEAAKAEEHQFETKGGACDPERLNSLKSENAADLLERCEQARWEREIQQQATAQTARANELAEWNVRLVAQQNRTALVQTIATIWAFIAAAIAAGFAGIAVFHAKRSADADNLALRATRRANREARADAVAQGARSAEQIRIAGEAAAAAVQQVVVSERTALKQLTAYVHAEQMTFDWHPDGHPLFTITFRNTGQTPAIGARAAGRAIFGDVYRLASTEAVDTDIGLARVGVIGAASPFPSTLYVYGGEHVRKELINKENMLAVIGRIKYFDVFGKSYETEFGFFTTHPGGSAMSPLTGNFATFRERDED